MYVCNVIIPPPADILRHARRSTAFISVENRPCVWSCANNQTHRPRLANSTRKKAPLNSFMFVPLTFYDMHQQQTEQKNINIIPNPYGLASKNDREKSTNQVVRRPRNQRTASAASRSSSNSTKPKAGGFWTRFTSANLPVKNTSRHA